MELLTHKKFKSGRLMPWGKGTVVSGAKGVVYLCGNTATAANYDPSVKKGLRLATIQFIILSKEYLMAIRYRMEYQSPLLQN